MSLFNWLLYLDVADELVVLQSEAHLRSAVSRGYYGVFGEIRNILESLGIQFTWKNVHHEVIDWLQNQPDTGIEQIGIDLDRLRRERNRADYNAVKSFSRWRADKSLLEARSIERRIPIYL